MILTYQGNMLKFLLHTVNLSFVEARGTGHLVKQLTFEHVVLKSLCIV